MVTTAARRAALARRIRLLVAATIAYNVVEATIALAEGTRVSSAALIGFGLDSVVEISYRSIHGLARTIQSRRCGRERVGTPAAQPRA